MLEFKNDKTGGTLLLFLPIFGPQNLPEFWFYRVGSPASAQHCFKKPRSV